MFLSFAETFKALSDPVRREILELLKKGRMSAGEIASHFDMTQATVSYHLKILKKADLIRETREKNFIFYELSLTVLEEIMVWISDLNITSYCDRTISLEQTSRYTGNTLGKRRNRKRMVQQNIFCLRNAAHPDCDPRFVPFCHFE